MNSRFIVHADTHVVVIHKPAGLPAVPARAAHLKDNAAERVQREFADALIVHRLDMATSGLMLFARGIEAQVSLSRAFAARRVFKRYVACVQGTVTADEGEIDLPLAADWPRRPKQRVDQTAGKPSLTRWWVLAREAACTRLLLEPATGRTHQLRVHLAAIGHPIVGDVLYGEPPAPAGEARLLLHASALGFVHPASGAAMRFDSPPPF